MNKTRLIIVNFLLLSTMTVPIVYALPNPAAVFCVDQGYTLENFETTAGQSAYCVFTDGNKCEQWAFYRGECGVDYKKYQAGSSLNTDHHTATNSTDIDNKIQQASSSTNKIDSEAVYQKQRLQEEIEDMQNTLRSQLNTYRNDYKAYQIAKAQFEKLNTLASIEEAVQKSKTAMYSRSQVLHSYFILLRLSIVEMDGIELSQKDRILNVIETHIKTLEQHQQQVEKIASREDLNRVKTDFIATAELSEQIAYQALSLISLGKLQAVYDKAIVLRDKLEIELTDKGSAVRQAERKRSFNETNKVLSKNKTDLDAMWLEIKEKNQDNNRKAKNFYDRLNQSLNPIFADLSKTNSYLNELLET